jgi:hypothetical protein
VDGEIKYGRRINICHGCVAVGHGSKCCGTSPPISYKPRSSDGSRPHATGELQELLLLAILANVAEQQAVDHAELPALVGPQAFTNTVAVHITSEPLELLATTSAAGTTNLCQREHAERLAVCPKCWLCDLQPC